MTITERMASLRQKVDDKNKEFSGKELNLKSHEIAIERFNNDIAESREQILVNNESIIVLDNLINMKNEALVESIKSTINDALDSVPLTNDYDILLMENNNARSGNELQVKLLDKEANKPRGLRSASGTGVAQLVSFIMRIVLVSYSGSRKILIVDENFSGFQDKETINVFGAVLTTLAEQEGFQIIMVEHKSEFLNVPHVKNIILKKENYLDGVVVDQIVDAASSQEV